MKWAVCRLLSAENDVARLLEGWLLRQTMLDAMQGRWTTQSVNECARRF